jgi:hypothetical protein
VTRYDVIIVVYRYTMLFFRSANPEPLQDRRTLSGRDRWPSMEGFSVMAHAQQYSDEDKTMQIVCYVLCGLSVAILLGLLLYTLP